MHNRRHAIALAIACLSAPTAFADDDGKGKSLQVTVTFGTGLNNATPGNVHNHHIHPHDIRIKAGGSVNFIVAGLHQIFIYMPGKRPEHVNLSGTSFLINDLQDIYYQGINPAGGPLGTPVTTNPSNASNRTETVWFEHPGRYLVICNVRPHFLDGMIAWVVVSH